MANYNVSLIVEEFKVDPDKRGEFLEVIKAFEGVDCVELQEEKVHLSHIGSGFVWDIDDFDRNRFEEQYDLLDSMEIIDLPDVIQHYMEDDQQVILKDIGHLKAASAYGLSSRITKNKIYTIHLHK
jgi:hypothetical protein